ncbi:rab proteins geranylgeranyltransferase component A 2-like [Babylonia areolata]|uniref:rab proteins geranylgeranyltransferase component A 2-like n=1 Tax=Babylonia areolata TaxID=304850 RepID=UPI003FD3472A
MASDLPEEFDVIVLGTGLPETLLAAAFSRIGLSVLHLDRNSYYSGSWANFSLRSVSDWIKEQKEARCYVSGVDEEKLSTLVKEGERALQLPETFPFVFEPTSQYHVGKRPEKATETTEPSASPSPAANTALSDSSSTTENASPRETAVSAKTDDADKRETTEQNSVPQANSQAGGDDDQVLCGSANEMANNTVVPGQFDSASEEEESRCAQGEMSSETSTVEGSTEKAGEKERQEWFEDDVAKEWRKFCFDLAPKLLYCSGSMVELLIVSDVAKYCEFRTVSRVLTMRDNTLEKVPCSRADVFSSKALSLLEKRLLMKFLTFAAEYDQQPQEYKDFTGKPFVDFLASKKLSPKIQHFILHSIAMATESTPTEQGLEGIQKFLRSLGRYGNTAFLFPLYGSGELPQAFCRLSAVFGGIYVLTMSASHLLVDAENKCTGIITTAGQRITCKYLIADPSYLRKEYYHIPESRHISRGIFVTDKSIFPEEAEDLSLLQFPHEGQPSSPTTTVLELPPSAMVSPRPLYMVHMTRRSVSSVQQDLQPAISTLFQDDKEAGAKPQVLWSLQFQQRDLSAVTTTEHTPSNVFVVTGPGTELDTDGCVAEAKTIFQRLCPEEEFLPKPPHPDDIIYVDTEEVAAVGNEQGEWSGDRTPDTDPSQTTDSAATQGSAQKEDDDGQAEDVEKEGKEDDGGRVKGEAKSDCDDGKSGEDATPQEREKKECGGESNEAES